MEFKLEEIEKKFQWGRSNLWNGHEALTETEVLWLILEIKKQQKEIKELIQQTEQLPHLKIKVTALKRGIETNQMIKIQYVKRMNRYERALRDIKLEMDIEYSEDERSNFLDRIYSTLENALEVD
jgi:TolA-binding protein